MPGGVVCSITACKNNSKKAKETGEKLLFFNFPKDTLIREKWITFCYPKNKEWSWINKRVCSKHFKANDYEDELRARLLNLHPKRLKKNSIPSLFLVSNATEPKTTEKSLRIIRKANRAIVDDLLVCKEIPLELVYNKPVIDNTIGMSLIASSSNDTNFDILKRKFDKLQSENVILKQRIDDYENHKKLLQQHISVLEEQIKKDNVGIEVKAKLDFKDFLISNLVGVALKKKTKARWTLCKAFTLRYFSKRTYIYLKKTLHCPLPASIALQQCAEEIIFYPKSR